MRSPSGLGICLPVTSFQVSSPGLCLRELELAPTLDAAQGGQEASPPEMPNPPAFVPLLRLPCMAGRIKTGAHGILNDEGLAPKPALFCWSRGDL